MKKTVLILSALFISASALAAPAKVKLAIASVGDTMAFDKTTLEVPAGATVTLTLKNNGKSEAMVHNWVLVKAGTEADVGNNGAAAGEAKGFIPDSPNVLAHTKLAKPGKSVTVTFTAPATAGDYPYICSYPGHYVFMKGVLKVK
jgi:azurin